MYLSILSTCNPEKKFALSWEIKLLLVGEVAVAADWEVAVRENFSLKTEIQVYF